MTLAEVEALLGGPAADMLDWQAHGAPVDQMGYRWLRVWKESDALARVEVQVTRDERVMAAAGFGRQQPGPLARLRSCLGW